MALDENNKLQNESHNPIKVLPARSFADASALQALIDRIAATRSALKTADETIKANVTGKLDELRNELVEALNTVRDSVEANTAADLAQAVEQATIKAQVETNKTNIEALSGLNHLIKTDFDAFQAEYELYKADVTEQLNEIIAALQVVVSIEDVEAAMDDIMDTFNVFSGTSSSNSPFNVNINGTSITIQPVDGAFEYKTKDKITTCGGMFADCTRPTSLDLSGWDVSSVTDMSSMFVYCEALTSLDSIKNWDTSSVTNMYGMFDGCSGLTSLDSIKDWDVSSVTNMYGMFTGCSGLTSLDLSGWDVSSVTDMGDMFYNCYGLTSLDLSGWDTSSVTNMSWMFNRCSALSHIKCTTAFRDWCWANQDTIKLPTAMRNGGSGTWELID